MKVYTKTGDRGTSSLYDGNRLPKDSLFFEVLGNIDELSSNVGMLCALIEDGEHSLFELRRIQRVLQNVGSEIATVDRTYRTVVIISEDEASFLEESIDNMEKTNSKLTKFILPGIKQSDAQAHICRSVSRRVERSLWRLHQNSTNIGGNINMEGFSVNDNILKFMNRLSDYFFVLARYLCARKGVEDCFY